MKIVSIAFLLVFIVVAGHAQTSQSVDKDQLKNEIALGAKAYDASNFKEAEEHFRKARTIDPTDKIAALFYAQAINAQLDGPVLVIVSPIPPPPPWIAGGESGGMVKPQFSEQEIAEINKRSLDAFKDALKLDPQNSLIYQYIASIYDRSRNYEQETQWLLRLTELPDLKGDEKLEAYYSAAVLQWQQAYPITTKWTDLRKGPVRADSPTYHIYLRQDFPASDRAKAEQYVSEGINYLNKALAINPDYANAYSYLALLHREEAKLAKTSADKMKFIREYQEAMAKFDEINSRPEKTQKPN